MVKNRENSQAFQGSSYILRDLSGIKREKVYKDVVEQIQLLIIDGKLRAGDKLPSERELANRLKISRASLREALRVLENNELLEIRHGEGIFIKKGVIEFPRKTPLSILETKKKVILDLFETRKIIEPGIASLAALRAGPKEIRKIKHTLKLAGEKVEKGEAIYKQDTGFHLAVAQATGNDVLLRSMSNLLDLLKEIREALLYLPKIPVKSLEGHREILEAIKQGDSRLAEASMLAHLKMIEKSISKLYKEGYSSRS
jgi:GntR family transcriptional repressor for pyruvate dehydrogenase complex